jgi:hypothetical protein
MAMSRESRATNQVLILPFLGVFLFFSSLDLSENSMRVSLPNALARLPSARCSLVSLKLSSTFLDDSTFPPLIEPLCRFAPSLQSIDLSRNPVSDDNVRRLQSKFDELLLASSAADRSTFVGGRPQLRILTSPFNERRWRSLSNE